MCETESPNLIDLSAEENTDGNKNYLNKINVTVPLIPSPQGRLCLDNNPFDYVQKLSNYTQDPFEIVEKEASLKALETTEVRTGNLLSLSSEPDLENESPPANLSNKLTPGSSTADSGSCDSSDSARVQGNSQRSRKVRQQRHRLLKLSITNATFNTPMSSRKNAADEFSLNPAPNTFAMMGQIEDTMLSSESPLKFVDDDIMYEHPPNTIYSEKDYDADLKLMEIPMLRDQGQHNENVFKIPDTVLEKPEDNANQRVAMNTSNDKLENNDISSVTALPDLAAIRQRLNAKRTETAKKDISDLIKRLKTMICESDSVDDQKKDTVNCLLETVSSTLNTSGSASQSNTPPQPITRQGTFDMDLQAENTHQKTEDKNYKNISSQSGHSVDLQMSDNDNHVIPEIMIKSSATYDGETSDDKADLNLPNINPISSEEGFNPNINDLMEQIQRLLEQNQINSQSHTDSSCPSNNNHNNTSSIASTPTFIVVMPTMSQALVNEDSDDFGKDNYIRRRSQSLSIHDKLQIVQFPIKPSPEVNSVDNYDSPPPNTSTDVEFSDFKTPGRYLSRRNSISSTTPYTPKRYSRLNASTISKAHLSSLETTPRSFATPSRISSLESHSETDYSQMTSRSTFGLVKPDLKKKVKTSNSILKSNGPLKATVPVSKIAPTIKTNSRSTTSNTSIHLVAKSGHMSNTSTPVPSHRLSSLKESNNPYSAACSTPLTSSGKISNIATTPIGKSLNAPSVSTANLRRRTISEFKGNSPMKTRSNIQDSIGSGPSGNNSSKLNISRPSVYSKTISKIRASMSGINSANKNKENKSSDK